MPLTDDRQHINMRGRRYTAPPLTSTCSVVCQSYKEDNNRRKEAKKTKVAEEPRFHNRIGVFRRKTGYKYEDILNDIATSIGTGKTGDGKVFVTEVVNAMRIRTNERGLDALK